MVEAGTGAAFVTGLAANKAAHIGLLTAVAFQSTAVAFVTVKPRGFHASLTKSTMFPSSAIF